MSKFEQKACELMELQEMNNITSSADRYTLLGEIQKALQQAYNEGVEEVLYEIRQINGGYWGDDSELYIAEKLILALKEEG